jgi:hypothetical protein
MCVITKIIVETIALILFVALFMNCIWNQPSKYKRQNVHSQNNIYYGGRGLFGEIKGPCGWKEQSKYSCCFMRCKPTWKTRLFPLKAEL